MINIIQIDIKSRYIFISDYLYRKVEDEILIFLESLGENEYSKIKKSKVDQIENDKMVIQTNDIDLFSMIPKQTINEWNFISKIRK